MSMGLWILVVLFSPVLLIGVIQLLWLCIETIGHAIGFCIIAGIWAIVLLVGPLLLIIMAIRRRSKIEIRIWSLRDSSE